MGGTKKPTISKLKRIVGKREEKGRKEEKKKVVFGVFLSVEERSELINYIRKMRYVTPYMVSRKMGIKLSTARKVLREIADEGMIKLEGKHREVEVYSPMPS